MGVRWPGSTGVAGIVFTDLSDVFFYALVDSFKLGLNPAGN